VAADITIEPYLRIKAGYISREFNMMYSQPPNENVIPLSAAQQIRALVVSCDPSCIDTIQEAVQPLLKSICIATNDEEVDFVLTDAQIFPLVIIDTACVHAPCDLANTIKSRWPGSELIFISEDMSSWMELIQRGAYEMLPKPLTMTDLTWAVTGAVLRHLPAKALRAAS
jgi:DNA-binding NtrC family response regulator